MKIIDIKKNIEKILDNNKAARMTTQPGWKWSECIKPMVGTETCQKNHVGVCLV